MDQGVALDPAIVSRARPLLNESRAALVQPIGRLAETLNVRSSPGEPSEVEMLIGAAMTEALRDRDIAVDGVLHGLFDGKNAFVAGRKTIADIWQIIPYENYIVTAQLTADELKAVMAEVFQTYELRNLLGFRVTTEGTGKLRTITSMTTADGRPLEGGRTYLIALNSFDSRSAGHRFMILRDLLEKPAAQTTLHPVQTREALIGYFQKHKVVRRLPEIAPVPAA